MRLLIVGATGQTGLQVIQQSLQRGHSVTAIVRKSTLKSAERLRIVLADPCDKDVLVPLLSQQDAVISCLGQRSRKDPWLVRDASVAMLAAMNESHVKRLVIVSGALLYPSFNPVVLLLKRLLAQKLVDARSMESTVSAADVDWTIVRPPHLQNGPGRGYCTDSSPRPTLTWNLRYADLAACLLDCAENGAAIRKILGIASR